MLEGARQRLEGQLHREGEASTMKMRILGMLEVRREDCSTSREMSGLAILFTVTRKESKPLHRAHTSRLAPKISGSILKWWAFRWWDL